MWGLTLALFHASCCFVSLNSSTIMSWNLSRPLLCQMVTNHHRLSLAHHSTSFLVDGTLTQCKTLITKVANASFHHNIVLIENRFYEICMNTCDKWHHGLGAKVRTKHFRKIILLTEVVKRKVHVVVDMLIRVKIVEANLNRCAMVESFSHELEEKYS